MFEKFIKEKKDQITDLNILLSDIEKIQQSKKNNKESSRMSLEPLTRLRKNTQEIEEINKKDKDLQFIEDKIRDILNPEKSEE